VREHSWGVFGGGPGRPEVRLALAAAESGLPRETVFLAFQLRSLDHSRFTGPAAGSLSPTRMAEVASALRLTLEI